jgi:hypothetical protein
MIGSKDKKISNVIKQLPQDYVKQIQTSENEAGQFVCQILINHNIPGAIEDLGEDVWKEIKDDWSAVTDFVESLPTLAPQILQGIVQDAEDVVSVVEEIITNPAAALTGKQHLGWPASYILQRSVCRPRFIFHRPRSLKQKLY